jgi:hypothetical protein
MLSVSYTKSQLYCVSVVLSVSYAESHIQVLYTDCQYPEYHYAECRGAFLSVT